VLKVWCKLMKNGKVAKQETFSSNKGDINEDFLSCLQSACKTFDIETPMWHTKHTKQLNMFRKIIFSPDDFIDNIKYDKFIVEILEND